MTGLYAASRLAAPAWRDTGVAIAVVVSCWLALGLGCATTTETAQPIHRPPTPAELFQINEERGPLVVDLIPTAGPPLVIDHVVSADATKVVVAPFNGPYFPPYALRLDDVAAFSARTTGRGVVSGAATGAAIGAGIGALLIALVWRLQGIGPPPNPNAPPCDSCGGPGAMFYVDTFLLSAAIGGVVGAFRGGSAGSPERFPLDLGPPPPEAPPPTTASPRRSASVVAPSAEVRSAPFEVAPVVAVVARGQRLSVEASSRAGWRVVYLPGGRVGYVQDARLGDD
jgi:hypothetical protein